MKKQLLIPFIFGMLQHSAIAQSNIITTVAGGIDSAGYAGDGGPATAAELYSPTGVAIGVSGNIFIADQKNNRIRMVNTGGTISTIAGNGSPGFSGDGGQATDAEIYKPFGVATDPAGNIYIADTYNNRIRKVTTAGVINTFAGNGTAGFSGDGGQATAAEFYQPTGVTLDASGNVYIADQYNDRIRMVNTSGIISTFAGNGAHGFSGDGGPATSAEINAPQALAMDASDNLYIADLYNERIRKINTVLSVPNLSNTDGLMEIYPNPVNDELFVEYNSSNSEKVTILVYDITGRAAIESNSPDNINQGINKVTISVSSLAQGVYILTLNDGKNLLNKKFIKL